MRPSRRQPPTSIASGRVSLPSSPRSRAPSSVWRAPRNSPSALAGWIRSRTCARSSRSRLPLNSVKSKSACVSDVDELLRRARKWPKGNYFDDFTVGQVFEHHWGRTLSESDNTLFSTMTLHFNPLYFNAEYAAAHEHRSIVINPMLVFLTVFGLTVEDLS